MFFGDYITLLPIDWDVEGAGKEKITENVRGLVNKKRRKGKYQ